MATKQGTGTARPSPERSFLITRSFDAPRDLIFKAWTDPEYFKHWWGPKGSTMGTCKMDLRPGGTLLYSMRMPGEVEMWGKFVYREILPPDRLVFTSSFSDENGHVTRAPFSATWPLEILNTLMLREQFGEATLTLLGSPVNATEEEWATFEASWEAMHKGFSGTFDRLAEYLVKV
jgi:uncharacterized protein YndB with AHSA1/START domain